MEQLTSFTIKPSPRRFAPVINIPCLVLGYLLYQAYFSRVALSVVGGGFFLTVAYYWIGGLTIRAQSLTASTLGTQLSPQTLSYHQIKLPATQRANQALSWYQSYQIHLLDGEKILIERAYEPSDIAKVLKIIEEQQEALDLPNTRLRGFESIVLYPPLLRFLAISNAPIILMFLFLQLLDTQRSVFVFYWIPLLLTLVYYQWVGLRFNAQSVTGMANRGRGSYTTTIPYDKINLEATRRFNETAPWHRPYEIRSVEGELIVVDIGYRPSDLAQIMQIIEAQLEPESHKATLPPPLSTP